MLECMYSNILILQQWMLLEIAEKKKKKESLISLIWNVHVQYKKKLTKTCEVSPYKLY